MLLRGGVLTDSPPIASEGVIRTITLQLRESQFQRKEVLNCSITMKEDPLSRECNRGTVVTPRNRESSLNL